ncbi:MAG: TfoX/Sxy family protein [Gemmatimonas sp.]
MPTADSFVSRLLLRLAPLGPVRSRAMFGGHGLYLDGIHIAIVHRRRVYFRVEPTSEVEPGATTFTYRRQGRAVALRGYRSPPCDALDDRATLLSWGERAVAAAKGSRRPRGARR